MKTKIIQNIKSIIIILTFVIGVSYVSAAWTNPTVAPTGGNVPAPINVGGRDGTIEANWYTQSKSGILNLAHLFTSDLTVTDPATATTLLPAGVIPAGSVLTAIGENTGKVGWAAGDGSVETKDLLWGNNGTTFGYYSYGTLSFINGKNLNNYRELLVIGEQGSFMRIPVYLFRTMTGAAMPNWYAGNSTNGSPVIKEDLWKMETFSGDDSGSVSVAYNNDTSIDYGTYRNNTGIFAIYGLGGPDGDLFLKPGPLDAFPIITGVTSFPYTTSVGNYSFTWSTQIPSDSVVEYGLTSSLDSGVSTVSTTGGTCGDNTSTLYHCVSTPIPVSNPLKTYYYRVNSTSAGGKKSTSPISTFTR